MKRTIFNFTTGGFFAVILFAQVLFAQTAPNDETCRDLPAQPLERQLGGAQAHCYRVELLKDQFVEVKAEQKSIDVALKFIDASGKALTESDSPNGTREPEVLSLVAAEAGIYRLEISSSEKSAPNGVYIITQTALRNASETDRKRFEAQAIFTEAKNSASPPESLGLFQKSAELFRAVGDRKNEARALTEVGFAAVNSGNGRAALTAFEQAAALYKDLTDQRELAKIVKYIGFIYDVSGNAAKALEKYEQAVSLFDAADAADKADALDGIGNIYLKRSEFSKALENYQKALPLFKSAKEFEREAGTSSNIGLIYLELGQKQKALENFMQALDVARTNGYKKSEVVFLANIGRAFDDSGDHAKAREYFNAALAKTSDDKAKASVLLSIGKSEFDLGNAEKALGDFERALKIFQNAGDKPGESRSLNFIARYHSAKGDKPKAAEFYNRAWKLQRDSGFKRGEGLTLNNLMFVWEAMKNRRAAIFYGKLAVNIFQQIRADIQTFDGESQRSFVKLVEETYRTLAALLIDENRISEAQEVLTLLKSEELYQFTRRSPEPPPNSPRRIELNAEEAETAEKYKNLTDDAEFVKLAEESASGFSRAASAKRGEPASLQTKNWQNNLSEIGADTVLLTTLVSENRYYVIITTANAQTARSFDIKRVELSEKIKKARAVLENPRTLPLPALQELYRILFKPLEAELAGTNAKNLLWSLDGELRYLAFAALYDGKKFLAERYTNVLITLAQTPNNQIVQPKKWRALGAGVAAEIKDFKPLVRVSDELKTIVRDETANLPTEKGIFAGKRLLDRTFSKENLISTLKEDFQLIHLATHFVFRPGKDVDSFLLLGDGEKLNLAEIRIGAAFDFTGTDLITLSACETALNAPDANGVEIESFGVIVQRRGAKAVLASLWSVADDSTQKLMIEFYRRYETANGSISKAEALRQAQIQILKPDAKNSEPKHPAYWAAFTILGDWR